MLNVLVVLWWAIVVFSTVMAASLALIVGLSVAARLTGIFRPPPPFVRRVPLPVWFTSLVVWAALECLGAALLLWNGRFHLGPLPRGLPRTPAGEMSLVAIGGSTILGAPYHGRLSFPGIVGWRLEETFPGLRVRVHNLAYGGASLEDMYQELRKQETRPDVLVVYAGHNEFLRYPPDREAATAYYGVRHPSLLSRAIAAELERIGAHEGPQWKGSRRLFDTPVCTDHEASAIRRRFRRTLEEILGFSQRERILTIVFIPASNESGMAPNRSTLSADLSAEDASRMELIYRRLAARPMPSHEIRLLKMARRLAPEFAETWYRLGAGFEAAGQYAKARKCYQRAIDGDRFPIRATSRITRTIREVASQHRVVLLDARDVIVPLSQNGILGSNVIHDNCHPNLPAHVALANATLRAIKEHRTRAEGTSGERLANWPESGYEAGVSGVIRRFGLDRQSWIQLCEEQGEFYRYLAVYHHDIEARLARSREYFEAAERMRNGVPPKHASIPAMAVSAF